MNLYKEALIAYLSGLTVKDGDWIKWKGGFGVDILIKGISGDRYVVKYNDDSRRYFLNRLLHREGGPAVECIDGYKEWWLNERFIKVELGTDEFI